MDDDRVTEFAEEREVYIIEGPDSKYLMKISYYPGQMFIVSLTVSL